jgi:cellulose synthase (UDP-forming)
MTAALRRMLGGQDGRLGLARSLLHAAAALVGVAAIWSVATVPLTPAEQALFGSVTILIFFLVNRLPGRGVTVFLIVLSGAVSLRYIVWRITDTLEFNTLLQGVLGTGLALAEAYAVVVMVLGYVQIAWPLDRKPVPLPEDPAEWPSVDVYIPSYNEDLSLVRTTVLAALAMDWPPDRMQVYILDDGRREAFRDFAVACGAGYIIRPDNAHAKAGNLNHAMGQTDGEFICVFDCDHVPTRAFLQMTMGWLVREKRMSAIQAPHHFYSPDPFQRNLAAGEHVPPEGNMFYGLVQPGNDFWNAAFFCGSCAVIRRAALEEIGGFAVETVTEDAHTALKLHRAGWHSAYLRLPLAAGLATERLILHIGQRMRWARGMLQIFRLDNPLFGHGLKLGQRLCYLNAMGHFLFAIPRIVFLTAPLGYLILGQNIIAASPLAILAYAFPHIFHAVATNSRIQRNWRHSFWSEIYETSLALFLVRLTVVTMLSPRRGKFNVTDKGGLLENGYFDLRAVYPNLLLALVLFVGLGAGLFCLFFRHNDDLTFEALLLNSIWTTISLLIVLAALAVGRETRQIRRQARIRARLPLSVWLPDGRVVQGTTEDVSMGGCSLRLDTRDEVAAETGLLIDVDLGTETVLLKSRVLQSEPGALQVDWLARTIAEEASVARVVFGRADAWTDWDAFPVDRPLRSLFHVLISIRGLFRPRARLSKQDIPAVDAAIAAAGSGKLARQTLVVPPRRTLAAIALLLVAAGGAQAQTKAPAAPPAPAAVTPPGAEVRPPPGPAPFPLPPRGSQVQAPSAVTAPQPATQPGTEAGPARHLVLTLKQLGVQGPMTMRGTSSIQGILFGVRSDEVVTAAHLTLEGAVSPALIPEFSNITITLNEQYIGTIPVDKDSPSFGPVTMPLNPVFFQDSNRLNFRFTGRYTQDCNDPLSGLLWATVSDTSALSLTLQRLPSPRLLSRLPLPFFDPRERQPLVLPFVLRAAPGNEALQAAAIVASWFGQQADFRGATFPVADQPPPEGNGVVVVAGRDTPEGVQLPAVTGPTIAVVPNPNDPLSSLLVVAGRTGAEAIGAATALVLGSHTLGGSQAAVKVPLVADRQPYDAPAWIATDRPVRFGELVDANQLQGTGYTPGTFHVPFRTAPDLYTWRKRPFRADIHFRAPPGPVVDVAASRLDVGINGMFLRSYSLAPPEGPLNWAFRQLGFDEGPQAAGTAIPPYMVFGQNDLGLYFDARPLHRGDCAAIPEDLHMSVDPDSTLDLTRAYRFAEMPNLAYFVSSGFPFTRMADLSDSAAVLPERPGTVEISAFLDLMGQFGSLTGYPVLRLAVARPSDLQRVARRDLLVIGTLGELGSAADLLRDSPFRIDGTGLQIALPAPLESVRRLFGDPRPNERRRAAAALTTALPDDAAALLGMQSPLDPARSVVALLAASPQALDQLVAALRDPLLSPDIQGDMALFGGGHVTSYRVGPVYTVGSLPFWLWPEWLLRDSPLLMLGLMLLACLMVGTVLYLALRRRASNRLIHRAPSR